MAEKTPHQPQEEAKTNEHVPDPPKQPMQKANLKHKIIAFLKTPKGQIIAGVAFLVLVIGVLLAIPVTRYAILGTVIKKQVVVTVTEGSTPVTDVALALAGQSATTNSDGKATFTNVPVGQWEVTAIKEYYTSASQRTTVKLFGETTVSMAMQATGRPVLVLVTNKITGKPLADATVSAGQATAVTNAEGQARLIVSAEFESLSALVKANGYNDAPGTLTVADQMSDKNTFALTPSGKVYFLSKRTGKINVMKSDLDGANPQVVVEGTGKELEDDTILLAARDWKYLALKARRDSDRAKLYVINAETDKLTLVDEGNVWFQLAGWANDHFIYTVQREIKPWESKGYALKTYNPSTGKLSIIEETIGEGSDNNNFQRETIENIYIFGDTLTYTKRWLMAYQFPGKKATINEARNDGSGKKTLKAFDEGWAYIAAKLYNPHEEYFQANLGNDKRFYYEYENGTFKEAPDVKDDTFNKFYPTFLVSPTGKYTFWYEPRDGKNTLLVGNNGGKDAKEVYNLSDFSTFGWYSDDYLLMSKEGSELFIAARDNTANVTPLKITDYHKPSYEITGYGYGYGGL